MMTKSAVVILAHGSRSEQAVNAILEKLARLIKARLESGIKIVWAVIQFNHPNLADAVNELVNQGVRRIVVMPYFLFDGIHPTKDIPEILDYVRQMHPDVEFVLADTLGMDDLLASLVIRRIVEAAPEFSPLDDTVATPPVSSEIEARSMEIVESLLPSLDCSEAERAVIKRIVHASGDPQIAPLVRFHPRAISAGIAAIHEGKPVFADVNMVAVGINRRLSAKFGCPIHCILEHHQAMNQVTPAGTTRSAASVRYLDRKLHGAIVVIGNAPTALVALLELMDKEHIMPTLVVGMPVGFVGAGESKAALMKRDIPCISVEGNRGGSAMAVATINALLKLAGESDQ